MSKHRGSRFILIEQDGWDETELYEADSIEEVADFLNSKGGQ